MSDLTRFQSLFSRKTFKPYKFEWGRSLRDRQLLTAWVPSQINFRNDKMHAVQHNLDSHPELYRILQFFTQADLNVQKSQTNLLFSLFAGCPELLGMTAAFNAIESVHAEAYSEFIDLVGGDPSFYTSFRDVPVFRTMSEFYDKEISDTEDLLETLLLNYLVPEGVFLFTFFVLLLSYHHTKGLFPGLSEVVRYSMRDELLHVAGIREVVRHIRANLSEDEELTWDAVVLRNEEKVLDLQKKVVDYLFGSLKDINGLRKKHLMDFAGYNFECCADLNQSKSKTHPLPWVRSYLSVNDFDFFAHQTSVYLNVGSL